MNTLLGYTNRANVEGFINRTFSEVTDAQFEGYLRATEKYIDNYCGYNAETTTSGMLLESVTRERALGKVDNSGNLVIDLMHPPLAFDVDGNPRVSLLTFHVGVVEVTLNLTNGGTGRNSLLEVSENRRKVYYPSIYFLPAISTVTPSAKIQLFNLRDVRFWTDISYYGGYVDLPDDIVMAANYICAEFIQHRDNPNFVVSASQGSMSQTFQRHSEGRGKLKIGEGLQIAQALLQPYVRNTF